MSRRELHKTALSLPGQCFQFIAEGRKHRPAFLVSEKAIQRLGGLPRRVLCRPPLPLAVVAAVNELRGGFHHVAGQNRRSGLGFRKVNFHLTGQELSGFLVCAGKHGSCSQVELNSQAQRGADSLADGLRGLLSGYARGFLLLLCRVDDGIPLSHRHTLPASKTADTAIAIGTGGFVSAGVLLVHFWGSQVEVTESGCASFSEVAQRAVPLALVGPSQVGPWNKWGGPTASSLGATVYAAKAHFTGCQGKRLQPDATGAQLAGGNGFLFLRALLGQGPRPLRALIRSLLVGADVTRLRALPVDNRRAAKRPAVSHQSGCGAAPRSVLRTSRIQEVPHGL